MTVVAEYKRRLTEKRRVKRRGRVIEAATRLFKERGYHETSMLQIADASGYSIPTIYRDFVGKDEIFLECMLSEDPEAALIAVLGEKLAKPLMDRLRLKWDLW